MIDYFVLIIAFINIILSILTLSRELYTKIKETKKLSNINKQLNKNISLIKNNVGNLDLVFFYRDLWNEEVKFNYKATKKDINLFNIYCIMKFSSEYFSNIYRDNDLLCNIRIKKDDHFKTIIQYSSNNKSKNIDLETQKTYYTEKNSDLITISKNKYNIFIINNISDYKKNNQFILQNSYIEEHCNAIISIPIYLSKDLEKDDLKELIACYTIYFSKPLNEKIEVSNLGNSFITLVNKLNELIKEYIQLNKKEESSMYKDEVITNEQLLLKSQ